MVHALSSCYWTFRVKLSYFTSYGHCMYASNNTKYKQCIIIFIIMLAIECAPPVLKREYHSELVVNNTGVFGIKNFVFNTTLHYQCQHGYETNDSLIIRCHPDKICQNVHR